jgi:hypothetical protein
MFKKSELREINSQQGLITKLLINDQLIKRFFFINK